MNDDVDGFNDKTDAYDVLTLQLHRHYQGGNDHLLFKGETYLVLWGTPAHASELSQLKPDPLEAKVHPLFARHYRFHRCHCLYHVDDNLWLRQVELSLFGKDDYNARAGIGPRFFEVLPQPQYLEYRYQDAETGETISDVAATGLWLYRPQKLVTDLERICISKAPLHKAFANNWVYRIPVFELTFEEGALVEVKDMSDGYWLDHLQKDAALKRYDTDQRDEMLRQQAKEEREKRKAKGWRRFLFWRNQHDKTTE
jgi:hypothetical protein